MQRNIFDERASTFDALPWVTDREFLAEIFDAVATFARNYPRRITAYLDVGTGTGQVLRYFARLAAEQGILTNAKGTGIDVSPEMLKIARRNLRQTSATVLQRSIYDHGLPYRSFDFAICRNALHHFGNPDLALLELRKLVKTGGCLFIIEGVAPDDYSLKLWREVLLLKDIGRNRSVLLSLENVCEVFERDFNWVPTSVRKLSPVPIRLSDWLDNAPIVPATRKAIIAKVGKLARNDEFARRFGLKRIRKEPPEDFQFLKHSALIALEVA